MLPGGASCSIIGQRAIYHICMSDNSLCNQLVCASDRERERSLASNVMHCNILQFIPKFKSAVDNAPGNKVNDIDAKSASMYIKTEYLGNIRTDFVYGA